MISCKVLDFFFPLSVNMILGFEMISKCIFKLVFWSPFASCILYIDSVTFPRNPRSFPQGVVNYASMKCVHALHVKLLSRS